MTEHQALLKLNNITKGIDEDELDSDQGWWETSTGANFGKNKLEELRRLIEQIYRSNHQK